MDLSASHLLAVNAGEAQVLSEWVDTEVRIVGHEVAVEPAARPFDDRSDILFVGALDDDISPNVDSLVWFVREIMPLLEIHYHIADLEKVELPEPQIDVRVRAPHHPRRKPPVEWNGRGVRAHDEARLCSCVSTA